MSEHKLDLSLLGDLKGSKALEYVFEWVHSNKFADDDTIIYGESGLKNSVKSIVRVAETRWKRTFRTGMPTRGVDDHQFGG